MTDRGTALTHDEAFELLAFLLASAHSCMYDPPGYGTYRLASAAERLSSAWGPRATGSLGDYLRELARSVPAQTWDPMGNASETEEYLGELISGLAREALQRSEPGRDA